MEQFEYDYLYLNDAVFYHKLVSVIVEDVIKHSGLQGWELCVMTPELRLFVFKRSSNNKTKFTVKSVYENALLMNDIKDIEDNEEAKSKKSWFSKLWPL